MAVDGVDTGDAAAVRSWLRRVPAGAAPPGTRPAVPAQGRRPPASPGPSPLRGPDTTLLPPVRLPREAELAAAARVSPVLREAWALRDWADAHRPRVVGGVLAAADARAAAAALGLLDDCSSAIDGRRPELLRVWSMALDAGLLVLDPAPGEGPRPASAADRETRARGAEVDDSDTAALRRWLAVYVRATGFAEFCGTADHAGHHVAERVIGELTFELYHSGRATGVEAQVALLVSDVLADAALDGLIRDEQRAPLRAVAEFAVYRSLATLARHGAVHLHPGGCVELTALGRWAMNQLLTEAGMTAPVIGDYAGADAAELTDVLVGYGEADRAAEFRGWLRHRSGRQAAAELVAAGGRPGCGRRGMAVALLRRLGRSAEPAVRAGLADALMWRHCAEWLNDRGLDPGRDLTETDRSWLMADAVAALAEHRGPHEYMRLLGRLVHRSDLDLVVRLPHTDHPERERALRLLFEFHPDPHVSLAVRWTTDVGGQALRDGRDGGAQPVGAPPPPGRRSPR
ncbi:hypothetical protein DEF23_01765 [Marinitenerispora sediminis]|uniref:Uncharacterized protein n=2 Tax=Marinitenerispora sediminis TaxID=1931232 RepID=A0A368TCA2_9ACTN|nr:hypothetical protein DEF28_03055 [Marinitenerispora sediminis]RCV61662.1 hypothetical protein DEF23_01765 [Marinitenerispora sediminis]RCV62606.1 hypothetical protein DEF24_00025 [Marinitenerispora sediminis]